MSFLTLRTRKTDNFVVSSTPRQERLNVNHTRNLFIMFYFLFIPSSNSLESGSLNPYFMQFTILIRLHGSGKRKALK